MKVAGWEQYPWLMAGFSARQGGVSSAYGSEELNLGWTGEDDDACVAENRQRFMASVAGWPLPMLVTVRQLHGNETQLVVRNDTPLATPSGRAVLQGDGLITQEVGLLIGVQTADCTPVLVADTRLRAVAAFHAGWRGTVAQVVELGLGQMTRAFGTMPEDLIAAVGPTIRACCFEVGDEVRDRFSGAFPYVQDLFTGRNVDLQKANLRQLVEAGVPLKNISVIAECTACTRTVAGFRRYFSHRAENGRTGRMLNVIGIKRH